ncbi:hypothetical protein RND81_07G133600 [Saponaria officinalis]|uniref:Polyprotein n=1 Tax=Saponaria officinalis TaxID=3572 RepID=A0AAW1JSG3_SAPOF
MVLCEFMQANALIEKLPSPSWDEYKKHLRHKKKDMKLQELIGHIKIEDATRSQDRAKTNATNTVKAIVVEYKNAGINKRSYDQYNMPQNSDKSNKTMTGNCWWCDKRGHPAFKCNAKKAYEQRHQSQENRNNAPGRKFQKKDNNQRGGYKNYKFNKPQANVIEGSSAGDDIIAAMVSEINLVGNLVEWIVDTEVTRHICTNFFTRSLRMLMRKRSSMLATPARFQFSALARCT